MFKFKIDPADLEKTKVLIQKKFQDVCNDPAMLQDQGKFLAERIRYQARTTKPINDQKSLPPLAPKTVGRRGYLAKYNRTDPTYSQPRSNLTLTGAFLNSLGYEVTGPGEITLSFKGEHPGYKGKKGKIKSAPLTNSDLAGYLREKGFDPYTVTALREFKPVISRLAAITRTYLRRALKLG